MLFLHLEASSLDAYYAGVFSCFSICLNAAYSEGALWTPHLLPQVILKFINWLCCFFL